MSRPTVESASDGIAPPLYWRMFTARATTMIASRRLAADSTIINVFAHALSGIASVGLNAVAFV